MENKTLAEVNEYACYYCKAQMKVEDTYCSECGYPEKGTDQERAQFHAKNAMQRNKHVDADKKIKSARNVLYIMAAIVLVFGFVSFFINQEVADLVTSGILGLIYLLLGSWTSKKPMMAILLGLLLYLTTIIISAIFDPTTLAKGIIFKILIIVYLGKGVYSASSIKN